MMDILNCLIFDKINLIKNFTNIITKEIISFVPIEYMPFTSYNKLPGLKQDEISVCGPLVNYLG